MTSHFLPRQSLPIIAAGVPLIQVRVLALRASSKFLRFGVPWFPWLPSDLRAAVKNGRRTLLLLCLAGGVNCVHAAGRRPDATRAGGLRGCRHHPVSQRMAQPPLRLFCSGRKVQQRQPVDTARRPKSIVVRPGGFFLVVSKTDDVLLYGPVHIRWSYNCDNSDSPFAGFRLLAHTMIVREWRLSSDRFRALLLSSGRNIQSFLLGSGREVQPR